MSLPNHDQLDFLWERFIRYHAEKHHFINKDGEVTMKNFLGGIAGYKRSFIEANTQHLSDSVSPTVSTSN